MDLRLFRARRDWLESSLDHRKCPGWLALVRHRSNALQCRSRALGSAAFRGELDPGWLRPKRPPLCHVFDAERSLDALLPEMEEVSFLGLGIWLCPVDSSAA